jgi:hypothetical protein
MRIPRSIGAVSALLLVLLGVWGALIPFVGPYFDYSFGVNSTWHYTSDRLWLNILPGALAVLAGLMLLTAVTRTAGVLAGWLAVIAGGWFAIGPAVSRTWEHGAGPIGPPLFGPTRQALELIGYFYGLGALIVAFGAFAVGRFTSHPGVVRDAALADTAAGGPLGPGAPARARASEPVTAAGPGPRAGEPADAGPTTAEPGPGPLRRRRGGVLRRGERQSGFLGR